MISESTRMSSAAEARFRVQAPNSLPRAVKVIALDEPSEAVVRRLAEATWNGARFFTAAGTGRAPYGTPAPASTQNGHVSDLGGRLTSLGDELDRADLVIMIAAAGGRAHAASFIGEASSRRRLMTTALIVGAETASEAALSRTLAQIRPWALMVVMASTDEYIADMMTALRA